jgi:hypothetical protein
MICQEGGIQARFGEFCWNGTGLGHYHRRLIGDSRRNQKRNPDFASDYRAEGEIMYKIRNKSYKLKIRTSH